MDSDNKTLVLAIIILIIASLSYNFNFDVTGFVSRVNVVSTVREPKPDVTILTVSPDLVSPGDTIHITVEPGKGGINKYVSFHKAGGNLQKGKTGKLCGGSQGAPFQCTEKGSLDYRIPTGWNPGKYYVRVYDYGIKDYVTADFTISSKLLCEKKGGIWYEDIGGNKPFCNMPTSDAGKFCYSGKQCEGRVCLVKNVGDNFGYCTGWYMTTDCFYYIEDGKVDRLCV